MFCGNCGTQLPDNSPFCTVCGKMLGKTETSNNLKNSQSQGNNSNRADNAGTTASGMPTGTTAAGMSTGKTASGMTTGTTAYSGTHGYGGGYVPGATGSPVTVPGKKKSGKNNMILAAVVFVLVLALGGIGWAVYASLSDEGDKEKKLAETQALEIAEVTVDPKTGEKETEIQETKEKETLKDTEKVEETVKEEKTDIEGEVNDLIRSKNLIGRVSVAVADNTNNDIYLCTGASERYTAWGFYLPVYMAFCDYYPSGYSGYKADILSSDAAQCNEAANFAIESFGGPSRITEHISSMGYRDTVIGRKFGDVNANTDNYTSAEEAVELLRQFNESYSFYDLCYSPSKYGVDVPSGARMYAQIGTENINVRNDLNVFAVIKGKNSDYSIVVMSQNGASGTGIIDDVLRKVHVLMEAE